MKKKDTERKQLIKKLKKNTGIKNGDDIYCVLNHVSSSGMSRRISFYVIKRNKYTKKHEPVCINHYICKILDYKRNDNDGGVIVSGCGMDMGFSVVYDLSSAIFPRTKRAGYALSSRWM